MKNVNYIDIHKIWFAVARILILIANHTMNENMIAIERLHIFMFFFSFIGKNAGRSGKLKKKGWSERKTLKNCIKILFSENNILYKSNG